MQASQRVLEIRRRVVGFEFAVLDSEIEVSDTARVGIQMDVAAVNRYESEHAA